MKFVLCFVLGFSVGSSLMAAALQAGEQRRELTAAAQGARAMAIRCSKGKP